MSLPRYLIAYERESPFEGIAPPGLIVDAGRLEWFWTISNDEELAEEKGTRAIHGKASFLGHGG